MTRSKVIGWLLFVLGIVAIVVLLIALVSLLLGSTCIVLLEMEYPETAKWSELAGPAIIVVLGFLLSGLAVFVGWKLAHPRRRVNRALRSPDEPVEES